MYNTRTSAVFRVSDKNSNSFSLKVFSYLERLPFQVKERQLEAFANDRSIQQKLTASLCPEVLIKASSEEPKDIVCDSHHVQLLLGVDVPVIDKDGNALKSELMKISNSQGNESERRIVFFANTLVPYMAGGRLGDIIDRKPEFKLMLHRYLVFTTLSGQLVQAVKFIHSKGIAHLSIDPSTVICSNKDCSDVFLSDFGQGSTEASIGSSQYATELMQDSVRFRAFENEPSSDIDTQAIEKLKKYQRDKPTWENARKVDWFGLGGTLFYLVAGNRMYIDSLMLHSKSSRPLSNFIVDAMKLNKVASKLKADENTVSKIRHFVGDSLLLIDGLLTIDRTERISFDSDDGKKRMTSSLRASKAVMSALELDDRKSASCASFIQESGALIPELRVDQNQRLPAFLRELC